MTTPATTPLLPTTDNPALAELLGDLSSPPAPTRALRDERGRFLPGNPGGPGPRPGRGVDVRAAAERVAAERGIDLPVAVGEVVLRLIEQAKNGDVQAAALLLKSVGIADPDGQHGLVVQVISGVPRDDSPTVGVRVITRTPGEPTP